MPLSIADTSWSSVVLTNDEIWQIDAPSGGQVVVDTEAVEANRVGIRMNNYDTIKFVSGTTVYQKKLTRFPASIRRMVV